MEQINQIREKLRPHLGWHGARLSFLAMFIMALFRAKTVNLAELATVWDGTAQEASNYRRMRRFFQSFEVDVDKFALMVMDIAGIPQPWILSIDRTNWSFGKTHFNILMLCVVHEGIGYPLMWTMLDKKKGNSSCDERMDLLDRFEALFPQGSIAYLTGDREFVGKPWLSYLMMDRPIPFRLRIRQTDKVCAGKGLPAIAGSHLFQSLAMGQTRVLPGRRWVWGRLVYVIGTRLDPKQKKNKTDDDFLIIITTHDPHTALADYGHRWGIETLFAALKTRGFCLESTHFKDTARLSKLLALLALAFVWAMKAGIWRHAHYPIRVIAAHGRRARSLFRYGFDFLRRFFFDSCSFPDSRFQPIQLLSCT